MKLKRTFLAAAFGLAIVSHAIAVDEGWLENFAKAKEQAAKEGKDLLLNFTLSKCRPCNLLKDEVFLTDTFKKAALDQFILVELKYPSSESSLTDDINKQNEALTREFGIQGYPTIILADAQGRPYAETGYRDGGPEKYVAHLAKLRSVREERDQLWKKAESAQGFEKAKLLTRGLAIMDENVATAHYPSVLEEIKTLDPKDGSGIVSRLEMGRKLQVLWSSVGDKLLARDQSSANKEIDDFISTNKLEGEFKQRALFIKRRMAHNVKFADVALMEEIVAINPNSPTGKMAARISEMIQRQP
ncbi:MAG: thioredoxin family protein [Verrucomicrobiota bacterium]